MFKLAIQMSSLALLSISAPASANSHPSKELSFEARVGELHVLQLWSDDQERFLREWAKPTPPRLTTTTRIERNKAISLFLIFDSCKANAQGACNLTGKIEISDPDGKPYGSHSEVSFWDNEVAPPKSQMALSSQGMSLIIEDGEKLGLYKVRIAVTDTIAGVTAHTEQVIEVVEMESDDLTGS